jgi:hypothetical protein
MERLIQDEIERRGYVPGPGSRQNQQAARSRDRAKIFNGALMRAVRGPAKKEPRPEVKRALTTEDGVELEIVDEQLPEQQYGLCVAGFGPLPVEGSVGPYPITDLLPYVAGGGPRPVFTIDRSGCSHACGSARRAGTGRPSRASGGPVQDTRGPRRLSRTRGSWRFGRRRRSTA